MMLGLLAQALPVLLLLTATSAEWLEDGNVRVSATLEVNDPMDAFSKDQPVLDQGAVEACASKGKPRQVDETVVTGIALLDKKRMRVDLSADYACG
jgi:hypothetical protein